MRLRDSRGASSTSAHLLRAAALAMRHALVNHAEAQRADKRGAAAPCISRCLHASEVAIGQRRRGVVEINDALQKLARITPRLADVVECRFFAGYGEEETAAALGVSLRTAQRDWLKARAWLYRELGGAIPGDAAGSSGGA